MKLLTNLIEIMHQQNKMIFQKNMLKIMFLKLKLLLMPYTILQKR